MKEEIMKIVIIIGLISIAVIITGCTGPSRLETDFGTSYNNAKFGQILNPEAERNLEPVYGMDGPAAKMTVDKYRKSFGKGPADSSSSGYTVGSSMAPVSSGSGVATGVPGQ